MADGLTTHGLAAALAGQFGAAVEAVLGQVLRVSPGAASTGRGWGTPITASGVLAGTVTAHLDVAGVRAVATQMMGLTEDPEDSVVVDMLRELWTQAASAAALEDGFEGLTLTAGAPTAGDLPSVATAWVIRDGETTLATMTMAGQVSTGIAATATAASAPAGGAALDVGSGGETPGNLAALLDIDLPLVVRFARVELSLRALTMLGPGAMVDMGRSPDAPVQLLVGSRVIAEGEVVVVAGNYGVRILTLVSPAERLKAMEL